MSVQECPWWMPEGGNPVQAPLPLAPTQVSPLRVGLWKWPCMSAGAVEKRGEEGGRIGREEEDPEGFDII